MIRCIAIGFMVCCCSFALGSDPMSPAEHMKRGIFEEEINRDLVKAAEHYQAILQSKADAMELAATALYRLAVVTQKQGNTEEATKLFQQLEREYPEDKSLVWLTKIQLETAAQNPEEAPKNEGTPPKQEPAEMSDAERSFIDLQERMLELDPDKYFGKWAPGGTSDRGAPLAKPVTPDPKSPATKAIHEAASNGYMRAIKVLVNRGVPVDSRLSHGFTSLHSACTRGELGACKTLVELGADIHAEGESGGWTAIHYAAAWGRPEAIEFLVSKGASLNSQVERIQPDRVLPVPTGTALHLAARYGYPSSAAMLIKLGADVNAVTSVGQTPLMTAARNDRAEVVKILLDAGAKMEMQFQTDPQKGQTALHDAAWFGASEAAKILLEKGANPNVQKAEGTDGYTPLHHTAIRDCFEFAKLLVKHGADVQAKDFSGNTALHLALQKGAIASDAYILWLLEQGLNPMQPNAKGEMPISMAIGTNRVELIAKNWFYPQWARKQAVSLVRRGSYIPAGGFSAANENASPPNLDDFLKHAIGPNYAQRPPLLLGSVGVILKHYSILVWRKQKEDELISSEIVIPYKLDEPIENQAKFLKDFPLQWGDIVEIDPHAYRPPLSVTEELTALAETQYWISEPFPDTERDNRLVRCKLDCMLGFTGGGLKPIISVAYFDANTNAPIETIVDGKQFAWTLEEVAGQRWLRVVMGEKPGINDMVLSYSLDGDSLGLMRLRRPGQPKEIGELPFQTGTLRFKASPTKAANLAAAWFEAIFNADIESATKYVDVPFSLDRKVVLKTKEELQPVLKQIVESKGKRPIPKYTIALTGEAPKLDAAIFPKHEVYRVTSADDKEALNIYVTAGKTPKVIGFSD